MSLDQPEDLESAKDDIERLAEAEIRLAHFQAEQIRYATTYFGYPEVPVNNDLSTLGVSGLARLHLNNAGDPWVHGSAQMHTKEFEREALAFVADLYGIADDYWGYTTSGGTEGNLYGMYMAREYFGAKGEPPLFIYSASSHYSIPKNARLLQLSTRTIECDLAGEMNYNALKETLKETEATWPERPGLAITLNIGTTMTGAIDQVIRINDVLSEIDWPQEKVLIHADAALLGLIYPFIEGNPNLFENGVNSIAVSGHKFAGTIHPCGIFLTKKSLHGQAFGDHWIPYVGTEDTTISGSRNGFLALNLWYVLRKKGRHGLAREAKTCIENAEYLTKQLNEMNYPEVSMAPNQNIVVFQKPSDAMINKYQLPAEGGISHVVVMQHITRSRIDGFCRNLRESLEQAD